MKGQDVFISILDATDLLSIVGAEVLIKDEKGLEVFRGKSNYQGKLFLSEIIPKKGSIDINHPAYIGHSSKLQEAHQKGFQFFLESKSFDLEQIVFTANKHKEKKENVPYQINVITSKEIAFYNPPSSADLLAQQGVFVQKSQLGGGSPNLRGFEANKVLLVVDGVRMNNAIYRAGHLQNVITIDPNMIDRTEVLLGPGSIIYGSDALGGVMHFYTRDPRLGGPDKKNIKTQVFGRYGTAANEKTLHADLNLGYEKWGLITSFTATEFGDLRVGTQRNNVAEDFGTLRQIPTVIAGIDSAILNDDINVLRGSGYSQYDFMTKALFVPSEKLTHTLNLQVSQSSNIPRFDRLSQVQNGLPRFSQWDYGPQKRLMLHYKLKLFGEKTFYDQLSFVAAYQGIEESRITRNFGYTKQNNRVEQVDILSLNLDASKRIGRQHEIAYGLEAVRNEVASEAFQQNLITEEILPLSTRYPDGGSQMHFLAAYATHKWFVSDRLSIASGMRVNSIDLEANFLDQSYFPKQTNDINQHALALSGKLGLVFNGTNGFRLSSMLSTGFRAPNLDDVTKVFDSQPGNVVVPNSDLKPEYTYNGELQLSQRFGDRLYLSITGFYTFYDDAIVVRNTQLYGQDSIVYDGVLSQVQSNVNARQAYIVGASSEQKLNLGKLSLEHNVTFTYGQVLEEDVPLDHIPPIFGKVNLSYEQKRFQFNAYVHYQGWKRLDRFSPRDFNNLIFTSPEGAPAWWTLNAKASLALNPKLTLQAGVENLLDLHYRPFSSRISAPGRNLIFSLRTSF